MSSLDYLDLCRLCLVKDRVSVPIFDGEGDVRQIFLKIAACLPVKVAREDKLPKKICDDCVYKVELFYQFWNTTVNAEKQLLQWLGEVGMEGKQGYVTNVLNPNVMKQEQSTENRLDGSVMQQVSEHQNNMGIGMMDNIGLGIPMIISNTNQQQQITSVPMDTSSNSAQNVQAVPGPSSQTTHNQISQNQTSSTQQEEEEESSEDEENSDDECDGDEGLPVKEESEEDPNSRTIEPTTFVNVSLACDEAGPSGLQQQKIADMPEIPMPQTADGDPKSGGESIAAQQRNPKRNAIVRILVVRKWKPQMDETSNVTSNRILSTNRKQLDPTQVSQGKPPITYTRVSKVLTNNKGNQKPLKVESSEEEEYPANVETPENVAPQKTEVEVDQVLDEIRNTCPFCEKRFINPERVEIHVAYVHRRQYQCDLCKKAYHTAEELEEHKVIHRSDYFFECNVCRVKYKSSGSLRRHQIRNHSAYEPKYVCEHCGRNYKLKIDLTQHIKRTHDSELRVCRFCGKEVKDVKTHEWRHMKRNGEMKYKYTCHLCRKKFLHQSRLDTHLRLHEKGFKCEDCNKEFRGTRELANHRQFYHGQAKIYNCTLCQKNFNQSGNFHQHVLTHAGIRPYRCDICEEDFTQRSSLLRHRRQHPGPLPPMHSKHTHIADLARNYLQKLQTDQVDRNNVLNAKL
ncbi:uncharacterized protein LOC143345562 isoform X19 [Colletes latitarsis]|uniref:uncharacterized protein LOC143345562 isoform X19 n=1 Tax=Colletes latitarsis TaxID=2605962 RepID=UPI0040366F5A